MLWHCYTTKCEKSRINTIVILLQKGSLGRVSLEEGAKSKKGLWYALPGQVPGVGKLFINQQDAHT